MSSLYGAHHRALQDRFETRGLADRLEATTVHDFLTDEERGFVESRDMVFLSTVDERGYPSVSYKGGDPGFVRVLDERTLALPIYNGNGMFVSTGNISASGKVGLLFVDFETGAHRLRVHGSASVDADDPLVGEIAGAELVVRVGVEEVFPNCPRYVHRYRKLHASRYVPQADTPPPLPAWKRIDGFHDVLAPGDRERAAAEGLLTIEEYMAIEDHET